MSVSADMVALTVARCSQDNSSGQAADSSNTQEETDGANAQEEISSWAQGLEW